MIFLIYSYFSFGKPFTDEESGEIQTVWTNIKGFREYFIMFWIFLAASAVSSATDRVPFVGIIVSAVPVYYVFRLYCDKLLVFLPMIIMMLSIFLFAGEIVATVQWARAIKKGDS